LGYTWVRVRNSGPFQVWPIFGGPNITQAGDCNHTALIWANYTYKSVSGAWQTVSAGMMFGKLVNGQCTYDPENIPHYQLGSRGDSHGWIGPEPQEYRIAIKSWQHNHAGTGCATLECHHPSKLIINAAPAGPDEPPPPTDSESGGPGEPPQIGDCFCTCDDPNYPGRSDLRETVRGITSQQCEVMSGETCSRGPGGEIPEGLVNCSFTSN
jgi:hypothetical protein